MTSKEYDISKNPHIIKKYRFCGRWDIDLGLDSPLLEELVQEGKWDVEKDRSSKITIIPEEALIKKKKFRSLDKTVYEIYASVLFSELFELYNQYFINKDFNLYIPETLHLRYKFRDKRESSISEITQFLCPGIPLNKVKQKKDYKEKKFNIEGESVCIGDRIKYLAGILSGVLLREGLKHGDPQLRHYFILPRKGLMRLIDGNEKVYTKDEKNGIAIIDVEHMEKHDGYSSEVEKEVEIFKDKILEAFNTKSKDHFYNQGFNSILNGFQKEKYTYFERANALAMDKLKKRFKIKNVNLETKKIDYIYPK